MNSIKTSNLLTSLANAGQLNRVTQEKSIISDKVRNDNLVRFNSVIGSLMQQKQEQSKPVESYEPTMFQLKETYDEPKQVDVKTDAEKLLEEKGYPKPLHSGRIYDSYDGSGKPRQSVSISTDLIKLIVIIVVGFLLISIYMKLNIIINTIEKNESS